MELSPQAASAIQFNLCMKLCQLNKVIELFSFQVSERSFQIQQLRQQFDPQIRELLEKASKEREQLRESLSQDCDDIVADIQKFYQHRYAKMKSELEAMIEASKTKHEAQLAAVSKEIATYSEVLRGLITNSNKKVDLVGTCIAREHKKISETCMLLKRKFQNDLKQHDEEAASRKERFEREAAENMQKLVSQHEDEMKRIESEMGAPSLSKDALGRLEEMAKSLAKDMSRVRMSAMSVSETHKRTMLHITNETGREIQEVQRIAKDNAAVRAERDAKIDELEAPNIALIDELKKNREELMKRLKNERQALEERYNEVLIQLKNELIAKKSQDQAQSAGLSKDIEEMKVSMRKEMDVLEKRMKDEQNIASKMNKNLSQSIKRERKKKATALKELQNQLNSLVEAHNSEVASLESENLRDKSQLESSLLKEKQVQQQKLASVVSGGSNSCLQAQSKLDALNSERDALLNQHKANLERCNNETEMESRNLSEQHKQVLGEITCDLESQLRAAEDDQKETISAAARDLLAKKEQLRNTINAQNQSCLTQLENEAKVNPEYDSLRAQYQAEFEMLQRELGEIQPPRVEDSDKFRELGDTLESLERERSQRSTDIERARTKVLESNQEEEALENERHKSALSSPVSGRNKDQYTLALRQQLEALKESAERDINKYREELAAEVARGLSITSINPSESIDTDESSVNTLTEELAAVRADAKQKLKLKNREKTQDIEQQKKINEDTDLDFQRRKSEQIDTETMLTSEFQAKQQALAAELLEIKETLDSQFLNIHNESEAELMRLADEHDSAYQRLQELCDNHRTSFLANESLFRQHFDQTARDAEDLLNSLELAHNQDIAKVRAKHDGPIAFFQERIEVLTDKCAEARNRFEMREARPCDQEQIARLAQRLQTLHMQLTLAVKDLKQYKAMMVEQEHSINAKFVQSRSVGVPCHFG